jgi:hypothetical protein
VLATILATKEAVKHFGPNGGSVTFAVLRGSGGSFAGHAIQQGDSRTRREAATGLLRRPDNPVGFRPACSEIVLCVIAINVH